MYISILIVYDIGLQRYIKWKLEFLALTHFLSTWNEKPLVFALIMISQISYIDILETFWNVLIDRIIVTLLKLKLSPHSLTFYEQHFQALISEKLALGLCLIRIGRLRAFGGPWWPQILKHTGLTVSLNPLGKTSRLVR